MKRPHALLQTAVLLMLLGRARPAAGQDFVEAPSRATPWEVAGVSSYLSAPIRGGTNPFGAGFGGRVGRSFGPIYVGATIVDYLGGTDVDLQARSLVWGGEIGFSFRHPFSDGAELVVRPGLGVGAAMLFYTEPTTSTTTSSAAPTSHVVDIISTASHRTTTVPTVPSTSTGSTGSTGISPGTPSSSTPSTTIVTTSRETTTETALYLQPSLTVMFALSRYFAAAKASAVFLPSVGDGLGGSAAWGAYGVEGDVGVRF